MNFRIAVMNITGTWLEVDSHASTFDAGAHGGGEFCGSLPSGNENYRAALGKKEKRKFNKGITGK